MENYSKVRGRAMNWDNWSFFCSKKGRDFVDHEKKSPSPESREEGPSLKELYCYIRKGVNPSFRREKRRNFSRLNQAGGKGRMPLKRKKFRFVFGEREHHSDSHEGVSAQGGKESGWKKTKGSADAYKKKGNSPLTTR